LHCYAPAPASGKLPPLKKVQNYATISTDQLVKRCAEERTPQLWEEFVRRFHSAIAASVVRRARVWGETRSEIIADLVQEIYLKLCSDNCRLLREFEPAHPAAFFGYLKVISVNFVNDHFKAVLTDKRGGGLEPSPLEDMAEQLPTPQGRGLSAVEFKLLSDEIDCLLQELLQGETADRDRTIFWLYYRTGLTAAAIASLPPIQMNPKSVESVIHRLTQLLRNELAAAVPSKGIDRSSSL